MDDLKLMFNQLFSRYSGKNRLDWNEIYLIIASIIASRSTCNVVASGAVIIKDNQIVSTGYCGAPCGFEHCCDRGDCWIDHEDVGKCLGVHAPVNAIIRADRESLIGSTIYIAGYDKTKECMINAIPCENCMGVIKNAGIKDIITADYVNSSRPV